MRLTRAIVWLIWLWPLCLSAQDHILFQDPFSGEEKRWPWGEKLYGTAIQQSGNLHLEQHEADHTWLFTHETLLQNKANFRIEAAISLIPASPNMKAGLSWSANRKGDTYFAFLLNPTGSYQVIKCIEGTVSPLIPWTRHKKIKLSGGPLVLSIVKRGWTVYFEINGKEIAYIRHQSLKGKYQGFLLSGQGQLKAESFTIYHPPISILTIGGQWLRARKARLDSTVNQTHTHEIKPLVSSDGRKLHFYRYGKNEPSTKQAMWRSEVQGDSMWSKAVPMGMPRRESLADILHAANKIPQINFPLSGTDMSMFENYSISEDGKIAIVSLDKEEGFGDKDLYVIFKDKNEKWSTPTNLGPIVNTFSIEYSPYLSPDNTTLYFASGGHPGYGQIDLYQTHRLSETWTQWSPVLNLGSRVNGPESDAYLFPISPRHFYMATVDSIRKDFDLYGIRIAAERKKK